MVMPGARCRLAYGPADTTATLASVKSRLVLPLWYRPTRVVLEKGPLNGCVCDCVCVFRFDVSFDTNSFALFSCFIKNLYIYLTTLLKY